MKSIGGTETKDGYLKKFCKFFVFSLSAGVLQTVSFAVLDGPLGLPWAAAYLISLVASVVWNFYLNYFFTFHKGADVRIALTEVLVYYCIFTPSSTLGGTFLTDNGWDGQLVQIMMMLVNFVTEFLYQSFVVYHLHRISHKPEH